eukprot:1339967-Amorphochlora_amoeboformis.AAC.1
MLVRYGGGLSSLGSDAWLNFSVVSTFFLGSFCGVWMNNCLGRVGETDWMGCGARAFCPTVLVDK